MIGEISPQIRDAMADAVHLAVCDYSDSDGYGLCALYAIGGFQLLSRVTGRRFQPQVGSMELRCQEDPVKWFTMDATDGGLHRGEFHAWIVENPKDGPSTWIDFSARHWRSLVERTEMDSGIEAHRPKWQIADSPKFLWETFDTIPDWIYLSADLESMKILAVNHLAKPDEFEKLGWLSMEHFSRICRERKI